ncbi:MAG: prepilin peptidase [Firmicutes bacterium]|nr:prepilin peptidase [Bacillota bacterium]
MLTDPVLGLVLGVSVYTDLRWRKVYNALTFPAAAFGVAAGASEGGIPGLASSLAGLLVGLLATLALFRVGALGGGDVKLVAAVGALKGYLFVVDAIIYMFLWGGVLALVFSAAKGRLGETLRKTARMAVSALGRRVTPEPAPLESSCTIPYALAVFGGTVLAWILPRGGVS